MEKFRNNRDFTEYPDYEEYKALPFGVWTDYVYNGQELPIGSESEGFIPSSELNLRLKLDFENFDDELGGFTEENIKDFFENNKAAYFEYLKTCNAQIDPYLHFACFQVQKKVEKLLQIDYLKPTNEAERNRMYSKDKIPKLSEMVGKTMCGERAVLAKYILQKMGIDCSYVGAFVIFDDYGNETEHHSFVVIRYKKTSPNFEIKDGSEFEAQAVLQETENSEEIEQEFSTYIFDITRPHENGAPSIYETEQGFDYELLSSAENKDVIVKAKEVLGGNIEKFGIVDPYANR
ncbi:MAG TPA: hypothetical protein PJ997_01715 [Candidatus Paceibacterota bacterium]|nr:hypothetical protein [Candidatus Paceibacterota bacterium]HMP19035.1 hypothetical protein [Candidatus Paceibacterota bacterium]HMP85200.1 hypothetical protein [Candidatus Paceibacterota bacterium]